MGGDGPAAARHITPYPHRAGTVGFSSHTVYLVQAVAPGLTTIRLVERPAWAKSPVAERYVLRIRVAAP